MTKENLAAHFNDNHQQVLDFINALPDHAFIQRANEKWTPGEQLEHICLCIKPIAQALGSKEFIEEKFGHIQRATFSSDEIMDQYKTALANGGKAPQKFIPAAVDLSRKTALISETQTTLKDIGQHLDHYSEHEMDSLVLPHPLLGALTLREMFFLMSFHALHHLEQTRINLLTNDTIS